MTEVKKKITQIDEDQVAEINAHLKLYGKLKGIHDQLAKELNSVIT